MNKLTMEEVGFVSGGFRHEDVCVISACTLMGGLFGALLGAQSGIKLAMAGYVVFGAASFVYSYKLLEGVRC